MIVTNPKTGEQFKIQREDLTGKTIHGNKVHGIAYKRGNNWFWYVTCKCGADRVKSSISIDNGQGCNRCTKKRIQHIQHPETGFGVDVTSQYQNVIGTKINGRLVIGPTKKVGHRVWWDVKCDCGHQYTALVHTLKITDGCRQCAHKGPRLYRRLRPYEALFNLFKNRAKAEVHISYHDFINIIEQNSTCHYCKYPLAWSKYNCCAAGTTASNLDKKDPSKHYTLDNIVACCVRCNKGKMDHFTYSEWVEIGKLIQTWKKD